MSSDARFVAPTSPLVHPELHQDPAELDAWLNCIGAADYAEHPDPCPCDPCRRLAIPAIVQAVQEHQESLEKALNRCGGAIPVQIWRTYRAVDLGDRWEVTLTILCDEESDQLLLDQRRVAATAIEHLQALGFEVRVVGYHPPTLRITSYQEPRAAEVAA